MKLVVATNFDNNLLEELRKYPEVKYIFGSFKKTITGHGRAGFIVPEVNEEQFKAHIDLAHSYKIKFLYTMNTSTLLGREYDSKFINSLTKEIDRLVNLGIDGLIVALPFIIRLIRSEYPDLEISVSSFARVNIMRQIEEYVGLGANTIIMHEDVNRDFELLKQIAKISKNENFEVELILNNSCLYGCPFRLTHDNISSITSMINGLDNVWFEYPVLMCATDVLNDPANIIRMRWIRPEDLHYYEELGIERFKIAGRNKKTEWILRAVKAYTSGKYDGDLLDILSYPQGRAAAKAVEKVNGPKTYSILNAIKIDNTKFPSKWLEFFFYNDCNMRSCKECKYCDVIAEKVINVNGKQFKKEEWNIKQPYPIYLIPKFKKE
ncbi:MAG: peptidase U32 family protein [Saccharolobus sp.]|jgi:collagenase-like PrtC family protease|uniref:peptidase U32 family protein n=1 Tax=Saccharolobus sp. TaxID=2100761 RepID=UPI0028CF3A4C|nr:peptidase U32 family protein [Saccharolobus sp.]MDT7861963.1 peptidase U32 family protein [Saccharolobus sp.]